MKHIGNTGMAVTSDCGDSLNVHPKRKQPVGERLARWALCKTYGMALTPSGPIYKGVCTSDGKSPSTFEIAEEEGMYYPATAVVSGNTVRLTSPAVKHPRFVRYGWQPFTRANLVNGDALPASTFRGEI